MIRTVELVAYTEKGRETVGTVTVDDMSNVTKVEIWDFRLANELKDAHVREFSWTGEGWEKTITALLDYI